jgi:hypothetical protein
MASHWRIDPFRSASQSREAIEMAFALPISPQALGIVLLDILLAANKFFTNLGLPSCLRAVTNNLNPRQTHSCGF